MIRTLLVRVWLPASAAGNNRETITTAFMRVALHTVAFPSREVTARNQVCPTKPRQRSHANGVAGNQRRASPRSGRRPGKTPNIQVGAPSGRQERAESEESVTSIFCKNSESFYSDARSDTTSVTFGIDGANVAVRVSS